MCNVIEPILDRRYIFDSWANRKGMGSHRAVLRYQRFARRFRYVLKCDIQKYFPSIDHTILKEQFRRIFKDEQLLALMDLIVDHGRVPRPNHAYFPGDDLFTPFERAKGLPIGNLYDSKVVLAEWRDAVARQLSRCRLALHPRKCVIRPTSEGLPFLGYVVWPNRIRVRGETVRRYRRRLRRRRNQADASETIRQSLAAWKGHIDLAGSWRKTTVLSLTPR